MSILWRLIFFSRCTSTHHKLALDTLRFLRGPNADLWVNLFLSNHEQYLTGSKAPDNEFKDFKNHVLHVNEGFWGGATFSARQWYQKTVVALSQGDWPEAAFNAGVLSHYFTDPFQPFHTGQTEAEGKVHRAAEWSICKSYETLQAILEHDLNGYPEYELPQRPDWLEEAIRQGAVTAHESYDVCVEHYDLNRGIKDPPSGLDQEMKDRLARLIGLASVGFARVLERAFEESGATPPDVAVSLHVFLAGLKVPLNWIRKKFTDIHERAVIEAIYLEVQDSGKVIDALPEDERTVRKLHAQEVLKIPVRELDAQPASTTSSQYGTGKPARGETMKAASSAGFQRTVISKPRQFEMPSSQPAVLETCLMVPLAKLAPQDYLADAAAQAYLNVAGTAPSTPNGNGTALVEKPAVGAALSNLTESADSTSTRSRPAIAQPRMPSQDELEKEERRLQKRARRAIDPEPVLPSPTMPVNSARYTDSALATPEMPVDMFAPLPPITRAPQRDVVTAPAPTLIKPPVMSPAQPATQPAPQMSSPKPSVPATTQPVPVQRQTEPMPRVTPQAAVSSPLPSRDAKTYMAQGPAASVVPNPHVRLPEPAESQSPTIETTNRISNVGQSAGFDFRNFSGATSPISAAQPVLPQNLARQIPPATPPVAAPAAIPAAIPAYSTQPKPEIPVPTPEVARRFYLELSSPVVDAPSIGPKTAERFQTIGINTVADLLRGDPGTMAEQLGNRAATDLVRDWQDQARLVCCIPNLRGHDAQFLVACQVRTAAQLVVRDPRQLQQQVDAFVRTNAGQRLLRGGKSPDLDEVTGWIAAAREARTLSPE